MINYTLVTFIIPLALPCLRYRTPVCLKPCLTFSIQRSAAVLFALLAGSRLSAVAKITSTSTKPNSISRLGCPLLFPPCRYAYVSQRGFYPDDREKANQDAYGVATNYDGDPNKVVYVHFWYKYNMVCCTYLIQCCLCLGLDWMELSLPLGSDARVRLCFFCVSTCTFHWDARVVVWRC